MSQVFISYAREDRETALRIVETVGQAGLQVWHYDAISPEGSFEEQVRRELETALCVVVVWSEAAARSHFLQAEVLHRAIQAWSSDRLVLAALDDTPLPVGLRDLSPIMAIREGSDSGTKELIKRARGIVELAPIGIAAAPPASPPERREPQAGTARTRRDSRTAPKGPQVFISYSHLDEPTVNQLVQKIEQAGCAVWIDRKSKGLQRYAAPIVRAIRASRLVALMCSQNSFASDHVIREVYLAGDFKIPFLIFHLDPSEFPDDIIYFVTGFPRFPAAIDSQQLRWEILRLTAAPLP
jgi:TIR domain